jgi:hypothetical protein
MRQVGKVLGSGKGGGAGLIVDYGGDKVYGDSFRVRFVSFKEFGFLGFAQQAN